MQRPAPSPDRSTALAFAAFATAAGIWIGVMAVQPDFGRLEGSVIVMTQNVTVAPPQVRVIELADISR